MFFHISLERNLLLHPKYFGASLRSELITKIHNEVEGTCSGRYGFIITVTSVEEIGMGRVQEGTGFASFPVKFKAIVFRPFKGEVVDAVVTQVNKVRTLLLFLFGCCFLQVLTYFCLQRWACLQKWDLSLSSSPSM
jgi:DNA-directed RNA polymerase II subunit RPB7